MNSEKYRVLCTQYKYPRDFQEFLAQFKDEDACRKYLFEMRCPDGFACPKCDNKAQGWFLPRNTIECSNCGYQASLIAGTIFQDTKKPLLLWFHTCTVYKLRGIIWWVVAQKTGVSASNMKDFTAYFVHSTSISKTFALLFG